MVKDYLNGDFDIDNRAALVQVLRNSVKGKWQTHSNKTLPFDEFKQQSGLQYLLYEKNAFSGWYGQWDDNGTLRNLRRFSNGKLDGSIFSWRKTGTSFIKEDTRKEKNMEPSLIGTKTWMHKRTKLQTR